MIDPDILVGLAVAVIGTAGVLYSFITADGWAAITRRDRSAWTNRQR